MKNRACLGWSVLALVALLGCGSAVETEPDGLGGDGQGGDGEGGDGEGGDAGTGGAELSTGGSAQGGAAQGGAHEGGAGGGALTEGCAAMALVTVTAPTLIDAGGDLDWSPGESATFRVVLTQEGLEDNFFYPGVQVSSDEAGIMSGSNTLFGLIAGEPTEIEVLVSADASVDAGAEVTLDFQVTTLERGCVDLDSVSLSVIVE